MFFRKGRKEVKPQYAIALLLLSWINTWGQEQIDTLTDLKGRSVRALILEVSSNKVRVKRTKDNKEFSIPLDTLDQGSQNVVALWKENKLEAGNLDKIEVKFSSGKSDRLSDGEMYDDRKQVIHPSCTIKNRDTKLDTGSFQIVVFLFGKGARKDTSRMIKVLSRQEFRPIENLKPLESTKQTGSKIHNTYDDKAYARFGAKYNGYACVILNKEGEYQRIACATNRYLKAGRAIMELHEGKYYDLKYQLKKDVRN